MAANPIDLARDELAQRTQRGLGMPLAGLLFWLAMAALGAFSGWSPKTLALAMFFGTGAVFPLGWALTRMIGGDLMAKHPQLTPLGMTLNFIQFAYWPALLVMYAREPMLVPLLMGTLFGSHFIPYGWFYRSRGYTVLGIGCVAGTTLVQLASPQQVFTMIPLACAASYALGALLVTTENRRTRTAALAPA